MYYFWCYESEVRKREGAIKSIQLANRSHDSQETTHVHNDTHTAGRSGRSPLMTIATKTETHSHSQHTHGERERASEKTVPYTQSKWKTDEIIKIIVAMFSFKCFVYTFMLCCELWCDRYQPLIAAVDVLHVLVGLRCILLFDGVFVNIALAIHETHTIANDTDTDTET